MITIVTHGGWGLELWSLEFLILDGILKFCD